MPMISTDFHQLPTYNSPERIISNLGAAWRLNQNRDSRSFRVGGLTVPPIPAIQVILSVFREAVPFCYNRSLRLGTSLLAR